MWKATTEQLKELKFVLNSNSNLYYWGTFDYEFNVETNELSEFNFSGQKQLVIVIESFERFKQILKILLIEKLQKTTWEDEKKELTEQIKNL